MVDNTGSWKRRITAAIAAAWLSGGVALAQVTPPLVASVHADAATIDGSCIPKAVVQVVVKADKSSIRLDDATCAADGRFSVDARAVRLVNPFQVAVTQVVGGVASSPMTVDIQQQAGPSGDEREDMEATAYVGLAIDTFGSDELNQYLNPEANGVLHERSIFGFDFSYRLFGQPESARQIWVYGETLHGVRSEDIDCKETPELPSCKAELAEFGADLAKTSLYLLRNATSLEAYLGVRYEFVRMNLPGRHPAVAYVNFEPGFLEVAGSDGDAKAAHEIAIGARAVGGPMLGSYLEIGYGKSELFLRNRNRRFKFDGMLTREVAGGFSFFAQLFADVDFSDGSDSIQSYFGLNFDVGRLFNVPKD
jgi:hypothetical protein